MNLFPLFIRLDARSVLLAGGGEGALAKYRLLRAAGARIHLVASQLIPSFAQALDRQTTHSARDFCEADLDEKIMVFVATGDVQKDQAISFAAKVRNIPVNVVDRPEFGDVVMPSLVDRHPLIVAISTEGASPVLAQRVRAMIEELLPANFGRLADFARRFRSAAAARLGDLKKRRLFWESVFSGRIADLVLQGEEDRAHRELIRTLNSTLPEESPETMIIEVTNLDDLTLREVRRLRQADSVLCESGLDRSILNLLRREANIRFSDKDDTPWIAGQLAMGRSVICLKSKELKKKAIS